jgi:hypothetical protein
MSAMGCIVAATIACAGEPVTAPPDAAAETATDIARTPPAEPSRLFVLDTVGFTRVQKGGIAPGFDVDGVVTQGTGDPKTCGKPDFTAPDGTPGIDNQFATLVPLIEASGLQAFEGLLQASIDNGGVLILLQLDGWDGSADDAAVTLTVRAGHGAPLLGTDKKLLTGQTFHLRPDSPERAAKNARVKGFQLDTDAFDLDLPVQVFGKLYVLEVRNARIRLHLRDDGRVDEGLLGGGITFASIAKIAKTGAEDQPSIVDMVQALTDGAGDLAPDANGVCTQISAALAFQGAPGFLYAAERAILPKP